MSKYYKVIIKNRKAFHDFTFFETYKAGLVLEGSEVKSIRMGRANFKDSFARLDKGELWLYNFHVSPYEKQGHFSFEPDRKRKLLLKKSEIKKISGRISERGMAAIPLTLYLDGNWVKVEIGLGKAKKKFEKREVLKRKTQQREIEKALRSSKNKGGMEKLKK